MHCGQPADQLGVPSFDCMQIRVAQLRPGWVSANAFAHAQLRPGARARVPVVIGGQGSIHPRDALSLPDGDFVVGTWDPGYVSYWKGCDAHTTVCLYGFPLPLAMQPSVLSIFAIDYHPRTC